MEISKLDSGVSSGIRSTIVLNRRFASYVISLLPSIAVPSGHSYGSIASLSTVPLGKLKIPDVEWGCITTSYTLTRLISRESFDSSSNWLTIRQAVPNIMHLEISGDRLFSQHDTLALFSLVSWCPKLELLYYPVKICRAKILIATHKAEHGLFVLPQTLPIELHINLDIWSRTSRTKSLVMRLTSRI